MNKQKVLETIDRIRRALEGIERALQQNSVRDLDIELITAKQELNNLQAMVETMEDKDN